MTSVSSEQTAKITDPESPVSAPTEAQADVPTENKPKGPGKKKPRAGNSESQKTEAKEAKTKPRESEKEPSKSKAKPRETDKEPKQPEIKARVSEESAKVSKESAKVSEERARESVKKAREPEKKAKQSENQPKPPENEARAQGKSGETNKKPATAGEIATPEDEAVTAESRPAAVPELEKSAAKKPGTTTEAAAANKPAAATSQKHGESGAQAKKAAKPAAAAIDIEAELPGLLVEAEKLSFKNTARLNAARSKLDHMRNQVDTAETALIEQLERVHSNLTEKLAENRSHQEQLQQATGPLLECLKQALESGQSHDALPTWDKIQGNISNTSGKIRSKLQAEANEFKAKINELRDWKIFAATEKKKELVKQMQHLLESKMHAADRSKHIANMHKEWKLLGRSNQNEDLWKQFKTLSDQAYEPCKDYFKQRKHLMAENFKLRRNLCDQLEKDLAAIDQSQVNVADVNKLLSSSEQAWKSHAPVEQSKIKNLQKRYYGIVNQLRRLRKSSLRDHSQLKRGLIEQAQQLASNEDNRQAMNEAKRLQQEWKKIGPTTFKDDRKYWEEFRAACDKIFEKRNEQAAELKNELKQAEEKLAEVLKSMEKLLILDDETLRQARGDYQDLMQQFSNSLDFRLKKQKDRLLDQFNDIKRKIDTRFRKLPDKKQVAAKNAVLERIGFLQQIEENLLQSKNQQQFADAQAAIELTAWEAMATVNNEELAKALQNRLQVIRETDSSESLQSVMQNNEQSLRTLCIESEIRANADSPDDDQALRMQIQLDQLKNGFGQSRPDRKENSSYAAKIELLSLCIGPLAEDARQQLIERLQPALDKLR